MGFNYSLMYAAYLHLVSVHIPVLGTPLLLIWVISNLKMQSIVRWKWIYSMSILLAVLTSLSYFTGPATADWVKMHLATYPQNTIENHALWGRFGFIFQIFIGLIGVMALSNAIQDEKPYKSIPYLLVFLLIINTFVLVYTAHLGGLIRRIDLLF